MIAKLTAAMADKTLNETLKHYAKWDVLIVDEFGFDRIEREECPQAAHLLYKNYRQQTPNPFYYPRHQR